jgi:D-alanyl-D-alanine carboxypeptidase/D-alanyl-D-alanine-endopeptidase (penicillin-binding protein 4)
MTPIPPKRTGVAAGSCSTWLLVVVALCFAGCGSSQRLVRNDQAVRALHYRALTEKIASLLPDSLFPPARVAVKIISLKDTALIFDRNAQYLFTPASNEKLFSSATALAFLGPQYRLESSVAFDAYSRRIYIRGGGDPLLSDADLDSLARSLRPAVSGTNPWTVVGDASRFDSLYWGKGWMWDDQGDATGMAVSALSADGNFVEVVVRGGETIGIPAMVSVSPPTSYVTTENHAVVVDSVRNTLLIGRPLQHQSNRLTIHGDILPGTSHSFKVAVWEPEMFTLQLFRESLERTGIRCSALVLDTMPRNIPVVATISHRLDSVIFYMNKTSDNLTAECLTKTLGAEAAQSPGSWDAGTAVIRRFLSSMRIDTTRIVLADGSGLSRYDLTSADAIITLLSDIYHHPEVYPGFVASLPIAGEDGTLSHRMRHGGAYHVLRAKTGTATGVSSLSGFTTSADGFPIAFSILMQDYPGSSHVYRAIQDSIGQVLSEWKLVEDAGK